MRAASPDDLATLLRVYNHVPPATSYLLFNNVPDTAPFGGLLAPPTLSHLHRSQEPIDVRLREDFARYRDFRLSMSVNTSPTCITLWASGRVTETAENGWLAPQEIANIAPAYPFLH